MAWGWGGGSCCKPLSCQPASLGPGLTTSICLFLLLLCAVPLRTWLVKPEWSLPLVVVWLGFCGRGRLMLLNQLRTDWRKMCNSSHQTTVEISHTVTAASFSISDLSNKTRGSDGSYSPWAYDKGRKFISRKQCHGLDTPGEERKVRDVELIILPHKRTESTSACRSERRALKRKG